MQNLLFRTQSGVEVELTESDMSQISDYYETQCTADYLRENHPDWEEQKVQNIAYETRHQMNKYGYDESEAIQEAVKDYEEKKHVNQ